MSGRSYEHGAMTIGVARVAKVGPNNRMHSDSKKRRSSFLFALLFASGDAARYRPKLDVSSGSKPAVRRPVG
jgi:hypothetical protein